MKTRNGLVYEKFGNANEIPIVIFSGMNIIPGSGYLGDFPRKTAEKFGEVFVVYQEGMSGNLLKTGWYTENTERRQLNAALELVDGRRFLPVTHSFSSILGMKLLNCKFRNQTGAESALPGVITSIFTSNEDTCIDVDKPRRILGLPAFLWFKLGRYFPLPVPVYPLCDLASHSKFGVEGNDLVASRWINTRSADHGFKSEGLADSLSVDQRAIGIVTLQDRIFNAKKQREIYKKLGAEIISIDSGHRWMVDEDSCDIVIDAIAKQLG